jgi:hypothetical protein
MALSDLFDSDELVPCAIDTEGKVNVLCSNGGTSGRWIPVLVRGADIDRFCALPLKASRGLDDQY